MAGFDDLVAQAMPYLATEDMSAVAGMSWEWWYDGLNDNDGVPVDWAGVTGTCEIWRDDTLLVSPTVAFPNPGSIKVTVSPSQTGPLAPAGGGDVAARHEVELVNGAGRRVTVVGAGGTRFVIQAQVG